MFSGALLSKAEALLSEARSKGLKIVTAESCTGGLVSGLLTEIAGSSDVIECGFFTYSN
jgi:nicotinamide-nucleotide amidase